MSSISNSDIAYAIYSSLSEKKREEYSAFFKRVASFLYQRRLLHKAPEILEKLEEIINKKEEKIVVKISSARTLGEKVKKELSSALKERYKVKHIDFRERLDRGLLAGARIEIKDEVIDMTMKKKIKTLQEHLIKRYE